MNVLWERGQASIREITDQLAGKYNLAYTTVLTTTRIMADKKYVSYHKNGRSHVFTPLLNKQAARSSALKNMLGNLFDGSPRLLAQHLIEAEDLTKEDIKALRSLFGENNNDI